MPNMMPVCSTTGRGRQANTLLTIDEAAARLRISPRTCREWLRIGRLRGLKYGKMWRIREADVNSSIREHLRPASSAEDDELDRINRALEGTDLP